jgi:YHS domain-containing protein
VLIYRKYYGTAFALRITALMFVTIVLAALAVDGVFSLAGLIPSTRPTRAQVFGEVGVDYKLFLNALGLVIFTALLALTIRRGATDPVCGMAVDRANAVRLRSGARTLYFCSEQCRAEHEARIAHASTEHAASVHPIGGS